MRKRRYEPEQSDALVRRIMAEAAKIPTIPQVDSKSLSPAAEPHIRGRQWWSDRLLSPWVVLLAMGLVLVLLERGFLYVYDASHWLAFALLALVIAVAYAVLSKRRGYTHVFWPVLGKAWAITYAVVSVGWHLLHWWSRISDDEDPTGAIVGILLVGGFLVSLATFLWNKLKSKFGVRG